MRARVDGTESQGSRKLAAFRSRTYHRGVHDCDVCGAKVHETRRGRCWGCYTRWVESRPVGYGAKCLSCGERRRRLLRSVELWGGWQPMCFSCAGRALILDPMPDTVAELKAVLNRERRGNDRRIGKLDSRVFQYDRRVGQRRELRDGEGCASIDDDMILEIVVDFEDFDDFTQIRELPSVSQ
jgi:hypothetical protein